jgi:hypothetical protein
MESGKILETLDHLLLCMDADGRPQKILLHLIATKASSHV